MSRKRHNKVSVAIQPALPAPRTIMEAWLFDHPDKTIEDWDRFVADLPEGKGLYLKNGHVYQCSANGVVGRVVQRIISKKEKWAPEDTFYRAIHR
jgi:hypothetical protein